MTENTPRMLPDHLKADIDFDSFERPEIFKWLQVTGGIAEAELRRAFNCGVGLVLAVDPAKADGVITALNAAGETAWVIGALSNA